MCGIFGYKGISSDATNIVLNGLKKLEYRGYDSWGFASFQEGKIKIKKEIGRIPNYSTDFTSHLSIGHTRWATHGQVTANNAHPHTSKDKKVVAVHNGIIENVSELVEKYKLEKETETDSEIIPLLINHFMDEGYSFVNATKKACLQFNGSYAIALINKDSEELIAVKMGSPIILGIGENEFLLSSDIPALLEHTNKVVYLEDKDFVHINKHISISKIDSETKIIPDIKTISWNADSAEKEGYDHFMLKEIFQQPSSIRKTLDGLVENGFPSLNLKKIHLEDFKRITILGCGTSWHSGLVGKFLIESLARIPVDVEYASEFRYRNPIIDKDTLILAISQSGETADTLAALREAKRRGASVLSICNVVESSIARESDDILYTRAGPEIGVASTKAFTTQVTMLYLLTAQLVLKNKSLSENKVKEMIVDIKKIPELIELVLKEEKNIKVLANKLSKKNNALYLGRGIQFPIALEGALKLKEVSYIHAEGYPAAEMKHGPIALIDKNMPCVVIATKDILTYDKILSNIQEIKARGGEVIAIGTKGDFKLKELVDDIIYVPETRYSLTPLLSIIPLQILSYHVALLRSCDIDKPRNLAKSVTVE
ncbi:glutamine--fructose-6-phosphate transaminase (isomerizing) [Candidatus Woesearchaeota archaeon]|nr:glutamine--fructose-6-phosphate transaminase (isomerizing) [Candidatus Woesearchaeota archaeon]